MENDIKIEEPVNQLYVFPIYVYAEPFNRRLTTSYTFPHILRYLYLSRHGSAFGNENRRW